MQQNQNSFWYRSGVKAMKLSSLLGRYSQVTITLLLTLGSSFFLVAGLVRRSLRSEHVPPEAFLRHIYYLPTSKNEKTQSTNLRSPNDQRALS